MADPSRILDRQRWLLNRDVQVRRNRRAFPAPGSCIAPRVIHQGMLVHSMDRSEPAPRDHLIERIRSADPSSDEMRTTAYVETDDPGALRLHLSATGGSPVVADDSVRVRYETPTRVVIEARLGRPGVVVLADGYDPGWRLTVDGVPAPVLRANLLMRAAAVASGSHTLVYTYEPGSLRIGACGSVTGLAAFVGLVYWARRGGQAPRRLRSG